MHFDHERLDAYRLAVEVARWCAKQSFPVVRRHLRDQLVRAADSVVLNIAEGGGLERGCDGARHHFRIALGSAAEAAAVLDLADLPGGADRQQQLRRVGAMLRRLSGG